MDFVVEKCPAVKGSVLKSKDGKIELFCCDLYDFSPKVLSKNVSRSIHFPSILVNQLNQLSVPYDGIN